MAATRLGDGLKKDVLAKDKSTVFKLIYVAIPDQPLARSALGLKKACDAQAPLRAGRSLDHVYSAARAACAAASSENPAALAAADVAALAAASLGLPVAPPAPLFLYLCL